jgi:hypothetical protein
MLGEGVPPSPAEAAAWFEKAATQGHALAQYQLGKAQLSGSGTNADPVAAFKWFEKSAKQGEPNAQFQVGLAYQTGRGVEPDRMASLKYLQLAAAQGSAAAQDILISDTNLPPFEPVARPDPAPASEPKKPAEAKPVPPVAVVAAPPAPPPVPDRLPTALAVFAASSTLLVALFGALAIYFLKSRLSGLEHELRETKRELARTNTHLNTMINYVESRMIAAGPADPKFLAPPAAAQIGGPASEIAAFKASRPRPAK